MKKDYKCSKSEITVLSFIGYIILILLFVLNFWDHEQPFLPTIFACVATILATVGEMNERRYQNHPNLIDTFDWLARFSAIGAIASMAIHALIAS